MWIGSDCVRVHYSCKYSIDDSNEFVFSYLATVLSIYIFPKMINYKYYVYLSLDRQKNK